MAEAIQEFCDSRGVRIGLDREKGVVRGVKILGLHSRNGRNYLPEALAAAVHLYEGAKVNVNHAKPQATAGRDYQDRLGVIRNVSLHRDQGLFGDLHYNPRHALAEQLAWDAEHAPENVGLSHNVLAKVKRRENALVVEAITAVQSVDLVADPATTRGLFESQGNSTTAGTAPSQAAADAAANAATGAASEALPEWATLTFAQLRHHRPDLVMQAIAESQAELVDLRRQLEDAHLLEAAKDRQLLIRRLLIEHGLPDPDSGDATMQLLLGETFLESLMSAGDETTVHRLVEQRAELVRSVTRLVATHDTKASAGPIAREQRRTGAATDTVSDGKSFVRAIT